MYDYRGRRSCRNLVEGEFPVSCHASIFAGHSMGGHGALILCALKNPGRYQSVSALGADYQIRSQGALGAKGSWALSG